MDVPKLRFKEFKEKWQESKLGKIVTFRKGKGIPKRDLSNDGLPCILYGELYTKYGNVISKVESKTNVSINNPVIGMKNDILIPASGETALDIATASALRSNDILIGGDINLLRPTKKINGEFLSYQISGVLKSELAKYAEGASVIHLYKDGIQALNIIYPSIKEQEKIAFFIELLESKIHKQQEKVELLKEQKKGFMQKIFSQELRFKDEEGKEFPEWEETTLNKVLKLNLRPVPKPDKPYMRLGLRSHAKGTFHGLVEKPDEVKMDTMYVVKKNDLIVNITFAWEQAFAVANEEDEDKLVSHRFPTYIFKDMHHNHFYRYFLKTKYIKYCLTNASPGGAGRNRVLNRKDFLNIKVVVPVFEEQQKIAEFLSEFDVKIEKVELKLEILKEHKKGFMQQMFI